MNRHRGKVARFTACATVLTLFLGAGLASPTVAAATPTTPCTLGTPVTGDYDGDGAPDLEVTVWDNWIDNARFFASSKRTNQGDWLDIKAEHLIAADLNGDVCSDVVAISPQFSLNLVYGSPSGLDPATLTPVVLPQQAGITSPDRVIFDAVAQTYAGVAEVVVAGRIWRDADNRSEAPFVDVFALGPDGTPGLPQVIDAPPLVPDAASLEGWPSSMAADDGVVVIGNAEATVRGVARAGSVSVFGRDVFDPTKLDRQAVLSQNWPGMPGSSETGDHFGQAVAYRDGRLAIGIPYESTAGVTQSGRVQLATWVASENRLRVGKSFDQNTRGVPGSNEKKDRFGGVLTIARGLTGRGSYDVVVGTPTEGSGRIRYAGSVTVGSFTKAVYRTYTQDSPGVPGKPDRAPSEATADGDYFGYAVGTLPTSPTADTLVIGAPGETNGDCLTQGYVVRTDGKRLSSSTRWAYLAPPTKGCSFYDEDVFDGWGAAFAIGSQYLRELP